MKRIRIDSFRMRALIASGFVLVAAAAAPVPAMASGGQRAAPADSSRPWMSIGDVHRKLEEAGYRTVEKIEREHGVYEVRATDRNGVRAKLHVDPRTGEIVAAGGARRSRDVGGVAASRRERAAGAECTRRRCRDDLPQAAPGAAAPVR